MTLEGIIRPSDVILVSGGARGITAQCVIRLAEQARCKFILLGRSSADGLEPGWIKDTHSEADIKQRLMEDMKSSGEKPTLQKIQEAFKSLLAKREIKETLTAIKRAGGYAEYVSVDITNGPQLAEKITETTSRLGPVTGIIHGAGNLADKLIEKKSINDFETVFSTKINGLENLLHTVPVSQLNFLVLFSSIVGFFGNIGQADYAMANEILNKTAHFIKRKFPSCHVLSIGWGPWDSGMVTPELKKAFEERDVQVIPADVGASILVNELLPSKNTAAQVIVGNAPARPAEDTSSELRQYEIHRKLTLDANPFLNDHRIGEHAVLPATCAATWVASACEQLYPGYVFFSIDTYKVLKGIVFDEQLADEYVLDLKEIAKSQSGEIDFEAVIWSKNQKGRKIYNYSLRVRLVKESPAMPVDPAFNLTSMTGAQIIPGDLLYKNGTLFHGPAFQGVEEVLQVSPGKLITKCSLPKLDEKMQGQFTVQTGNPFIYDAIVQSLLIWAQRYYQAPCLPSYMERLEQYKAIPFGETIYVTLDVTSQSETAVLGDLTVQDATGQSYVWIKGLQGTISPRLKNLIGSHNSAN
ncbi:MAG TPA: SDR family NAD(P)-dependent oxidoreductase [Anaerolineaceae bacterium]|nr:SDR family NAD(P)-dependent oxidoreductase [Anaerolineaceae bacterium]